MTLRNLVISLASRITLKTGEDVVNKILYFNFENTFPQLQIQQISTKIKKGLNKSSMKGACYGKKRRDR